MNILNQRSLSVMLCAAFIVAPTLAYDENEPFRFNKTTERATEYNGPEFRALMEQIAAEEAVRLATIKATDPERDSNGGICQIHRDGCLGDPRFYHWGEDGSGIRQEVLFTSRGGATISGHVWATIDGPASRPAILINSGSVQANEELWGWAGAVLATRGYVVLTWDPQGQGLSDTMGACSDDFPDLQDCPDRNTGFPAQSNPTQPFYLGSQDALDFLLSTPDSPYTPRDSLNGLNHAGKQNRRVADGQNDEFNPLWAMVDPERVGVAGNSLGAASASQLAMFDERIDALVAWDNLRGAVENSQFGGADLIPRVPGLGISNDYGLDVVPKTTQPDSESKNAAFDSHREHGQDSAQINIRGGTHFASGYIPNAKFGATLYGMDLTAYYTAAWFDKYVKGDPAADALLRSNRFTCDPRSAAIEEQVGSNTPGEPGDENMFSIDLTSKINIVLESGGRLVCDDVRSGCDGNFVNQCGEPPYSYLDAAFSVAEGVVAVAGFGESSGTAGDSVAAGSVELSNNSDADQQLTSITLEASDAGIFSRLTATANNATANVNNPQASNSLVFSPAVTIPAGSSVTVDFSALLSNDEANTASGVVWGNVAWAADNSAARIDISQISVASALLLALFVAMPLLLVTRRNRYLASLALAGLLVMSCGGGGQSPGGSNAGNNPAGGNSGPTDRSSTLTVTRVVSQSGGSDVGYAGLPAQVANITRQGQ